MIRTNVPFDHGDAFLRTYLADQLPQPQPHISSQNFVAILRLPHKRVLQLQYRMGSTSIAISRHISFPLSSGARIAAQALLLKELLLKPIPSKNEGLVRPEVAVEHDST